MPVALNAGEKADAPLFGLAVCDAAQIAASWERDGEPLRSEDDCLSIINSVFPKNGPHMPLGRGDDCAELIFPRNNAALSTDFFWQDAHFRTWYSTPFEVGAKALAGAVSDLAAAGARPLGFSLGLMLPERCSRRALRHMMQGMHSVAEAHGLVLSGGDLSRSGLLGFSVTVWGESTLPEPPRFFQRGQAQPGDIIFLIGAVGMARVGFLHLESQGRSAIHTCPACVMAHLLPRPLVAEGQSLTRLATDFARQHPETPGRMALMDVSDGLARDLPRLLGTLGADLTLPPRLIHPEIHAAAEKNGLPAITYLLQGAEDYALLGSCSPALWKHVQKTLPHAVALGRAVSRMGIVLEGAPVTEHGFDHFAAHDHESADSPAPAQHTPPETCSAGTGARSALPHAPGASPEVQENGADASAASGPESIPPGAPSAPLMAAPPASLRCAAQRPLPESCAAAVEATAQVCRAAWGRGLLAGFNGNASCLVALPEHEATCLITRSGAAKSGLTGQDFALLALHGGLLAGAAPSSEAGMHLAVYAACPETRAVLHTHPPCLLALGLLVPPGERLDLPLYEAAAYRACLAFVPALPPGSAELAEAVAEAARTHPAIWLENHGLVAHGHSLHQALALMEELEQLAAVQIQTLQRQPA